MGPGALTARGWRSGTGGSPGTCSGRSSCTRPTASVASSARRTARRSPLHGFAVDARDDASEVLTALYAALAERWTDGGFFRHSVSALADDRTAEAAWLDLGFGRSGAFAARRLETPVAPGPAPHIEVREATSEDIEVVSRLTHVNVRHHRTTPILWPYLRETDAALHAFEAQALADEANVAFVAYQEGRPVALQLYLRAGFGAEMAHPERSVYLFEAVVNEAARNTGIGSALLAHGLGWARDQGYEVCTLHYATANPSGRRFWQRHGFVRLVHSMGRHVDERIAWARAYEDEGE
ncbi:MAG: GNAT family N-acetyltransferase [Dehalococcoidia bacterium]|nr:GNAT family N-acetyltransferase [Dehalococcoidia bacterium]